jgi:hypothetical protein
MRRGDNLRRFQNISVSLWKIAYVHVHELFSNSRNLLFDGTHIHAVPTILNSFALYHSVPVSIHDLDVVSQGSSLERKETR